MTTQNRPEVPGNAARVAASLSLFGPIAMVFLSALLPKDDPPLHPVDNSWYCQLTAFVCFFGIVSAGWALTHRTKETPAAVPTIAILGIIGSAVIGLVAFFLSSIHSIHT